MNDISVLMSVHAGDRSNYFADALCSLANQTFPAKEIILVEDGVLNDALYQIIENTRNKLNIVSVKIQENAGLANALNVGLSYCSCNFIARMDSDDICLPDRFEIQINHMKNDNSLAVCGSWVEEFDESSNVNVIKKLPTDHDKIVRFSKFRNPIAHPVALIRKDCLNAVGGYPLFRTSQDYALWSLLIMHGYKFSNIPKILLRMRVNSSFYSRRGLKYLSGEISVIRFQYSIGFLNGLEYIRNLLTFAMIRLSPDYLKKILYKYAR